MCVELRQDEPVMTSTVRAVSKHDEAAAGGAALALFHASLLLAVLILLAARSASAQSNVVPGSYRLDPSVTHVYPPRPDSAPRLDSLFPAPLSGEMAHADSAPAPSTPLASVALGHPTSFMDSLDWEMWKSTAENAEGYRIIVSLFDRRLWVMRGRDTLRSAPVGVALGTTLDYEGRSWTFVTPRGRYSVLGKRANPVWTPPDWHYYEVAQEGGLKLDSISRARPVYLADGSRLEVRHDEVGLNTIANGFQPLPTDEEIIFDSTLYIPPTGTKNRRIQGELGRYRLELGDGYLLHGTPHTESIGLPSTHGCIRLGDEDIEWLYRHVPAGTAVFIY
jgi:hypothetical protein